MGNFARLLVNGATVKLADGLNMNKELNLLGGTTALDDGSTVTMAQVVLSANATLRMGTAGGTGVKLHFAPSGYLAWTGTLTIANWNGGVYGGGPDQIWFGTSVGGLTASQLTQIKWINPFGAGDVVGAYQLATGEIVPAVGQSQFVAGSIVPSQGTTPFSATVNGIAGTSYRVLGTYSLDPVSWHLVATGSGSFSFNDPDSLTQPHIFYKVVPP